MEWLAAATATATTATATAAAPAATPAAATVTVPASTPAFATTERSVLKRVDGCGRGRKRGALRIVTLPVAPQVHGRPLPALVNRGIER